MFPIKVINRLLGVTSVSVRAVLKEARLDCKIRIYHVNLVQFAFNKNCMKILIKKSTFNLLWIYLKLCEHQLTSLKKTLHWVTLNPFQFFSFCKPPLSLWPPLDIFLFFTFVWPTIKLIRTLRDSFCCMSDFLSHNDKGLLCLISYFQ